MAVEKGARIWSMTVTPPRTCSRCSVLPEQCWHRSVGPVSNPAAVFPPVMVMVVLGGDYHLSCSKICAADHKQTLHTVDSPEFCILTLP